MVQSSTIVLLAALAASSVASPIGRDLVSRDGLSSELEVRGPGKVSTPAAPAVAEENKQAAKEQKKSAENATGVKAGQHAQHIAAQQAPRRRVRRELLDLYIRDLVARTRNEYNDRPVKPTRRTGVKAPVLTTDRQRANRDKEDKQKAADLKALEASQEGQGSTSPKKPRDLLDEDLFTRDFEVDELD